MRALQADPEATAPHDGAAECRPVGCVEEVFVCELCGLVGPAPRPRVCPACGAGRG